MYWFFSLKHAIQLKIITEYEHSTWLRHCFIDWLNTLWYYCLQLKFSSSEIWWLLRIAILGVFDFDASVTFCQKSVKNKYGTQKYYSDDGFLFNLKHETANMVKINPPPTIVGTVLLHSFPPKDLFCNVSARLDSIVPVWCKVRIYITKKTVTTAKYSYYYVTTLILIVHVYYSSDWCYFRPCVDKTLFITPSLFNAKSFTDVP